MQINSWDTFVSKIELLKFCCGLVHNIGALAIIHYGLCMYKNDSTFTVGYVGYAPTKSHTDKTSILTLFHESQMLCESQITPNNHSSNNAFKAHSECGRFCKENTGFLQLTDMNCFNQVLESLFAGSNLVMYKDPPHTLAMFHNFVKSSFGLSSLKAVKSVEFHEILWDSWDVVNDTLGCTPQVQKLYIIISPINCLQPVHLRQFCLKLTRLARLNEILLAPAVLPLEHDYLTPEIVASILDTIHSKIERMSMRNIHIAEAISHFSHIMTPHLQSLKLSYARLKEDHIKVLSDFLPKTSNLEELYLSENTVGMAGVSLAQQLQSCTRLRKLELDYTKLTDQGVIELAQRFVFFPNLTELDISGNVVGNTAVHAVFKHLTKLHRLDMTAHVDNQCSALVKECATAIQERTPDTGSLVIGPIYITTSTIKLICRIGRKYLD